MKTFIIDNKGNRWVWNCGWYIVDKKGVPLQTRARRAIRYWHKWELTETYHRATGIESMEYEHISCTRQRPDSRQQPMSHAEFRRSITILNGENKREREVLHSMDRPGRAWRRFIQRDTWDHPLFGSVKLLASDGCHAIIETIDGDHEKVCFENLTEPATIAVLPKKDAPTPRAKKEAGAVSDLLAKYLNLE